MTPQLVEHFFRREYGKWVAILSSRVGIQYLEIIEDAVQLALMKALETWTINGLPENPSGWVFKVASNQLIDELRRHERQSRLINDKIAVLESELTQEVILNPQDELLEMLFVCCHDAIAEQSKIVLALKVLCGFDIKEIALRLFISADNAYKRLTRARNSLRQQPSLFEPPSESQWADRVKAVNKILYLLFTEGYLGVNKAFSIRHELCHEAIRLTTALINGKQTPPAETFALLALMHFHLARMASRLNSAGELLLLEEQDRSLWDRQHIEQGMVNLERSAQGSDFSRYHGEAAIAAEHCFAPSFAQTRWDKVVENYFLLEQIAPSPLHRLNRAIALAQCKGPQAGLQLLTTMTPPKWLETSYLWLAALADLHFRCHNIEQADCYASAALAASPTPYIKKLLQRRWSRHL